MSGGNCPETPRQKMIGMMYLFLTAMLALNVSGELLKAFILVDESIQQSTSTIEVKNNVTYYNFSKDAETSPRAAEKYAVADSVKIHADSLVKFITDLKWELIRSVDDSEEATLTNYNGLDNQDKAAQIMMVEKNGQRGKDLKANIDAFKELVLNYLSNDRDSVLRRNVENALNTDDSKDGEVNRSWVSEKFEHIPMAASLALMSDMIGKIRNTESDMLRYLYSSVDASSFKFTGVEAYVIPTSKVVIRGGEYSAQVLVAGRDDSMDPDFEIPGVNDNNIVVENGVGNIKIPATGNGPKSIDGEVKILGPEGYETRPFTLDYEVIEPLVVISPTKMNVFYEAVENPVTISVPGVNSKDISISITNAKYRKYKNEYLVTTKAGTAGLKSRITVFAQTESGKRKMGTMDFRIKRIPPPIAKVGGINEGKLNKGLLLAQTGIVAEMEDFDFELEYKVFQFNVSAVKNGYNIDEASKSNRFTKAQQDLIKGLTRGSKVFINDIKAIGPDKRSKKLGSITITLD